MTAHSMTGFGRASGEADGVVVNVEIRTVNHRFLDVVTKLPPIYADVELDVARICRELLTRGRVDILATRSAQDTGGYEVRFNRELFAAYVDACQDALGAAKIKSATAREQIVLQALNRREIVETVFVAQLGDSERQLLASVVKSAVESLCTMRAHEGALLAEELLRFLGQMETIVAELKSQAATVSGLFSERLRARLEKLTPDVEIDPARLAQEIAILADRTDVTEELSRLEAHSAQFRALLGTIGNGRKLDFLVQEMGREINTCGSKAQNSAVQLLVVEGKALLEKMREQVQNIE